MAEKLSGSDRIIDYVPGYEYEAVITLGGKVWNVEFTSKSTDLRNLEEEAMKAAVSKATISITKKK